MKIQPSDFVDLVKVSGETSINIAMRSVSILFALLNNLEDGDTLEFDDIMVTGFGDNIFAVDFKMNTEEILESISELQIKTMEA